MSAMDREIAQLLADVKNQLTLTATAFRELRYSRVLDSGTRMFNSAGVIELSYYKVPFQSVMVQSNSGQKTIVHNQPRTQIPTEGNGVAIVGPYQMGVYNIAGSALTFYGNPGDTITYTVFAQPQPPAAMSAVVQFVSAGVTVQGTVTAQTPATSDIYTESAQSRTTNGNTSTLTWPAQVTDAFVGVNVTGFAGGTNVVVSVQQQDANGVWQTIASTSAITAVGTAQLSVGPGTNGVLLRSGGSYRLAWTVTGVFTTLTFQLGVTAR